MGIKIGDTRKIELLSAIKNIDAINLKIGDKYAELTTDITKTNGSPQLKFSKDGNEYYIREKFEVSGNWSITDLPLHQSKDITGQFPDFSIDTSIKYLTCKLDISSDPEKVLSVPETGDFTVAGVTTPLWKVSFIREGGTLKIKNTGPLSIRGGIHGRFTIE